MEMLRAHSRRPEVEAKLVSDPVCGMSVDPATADQRSDFGGSTYYFCSAGCKETFDKDPGKYIAQAKTAPGR
ncbi:MAG TPA: YHS domain-containing protein, partial [Candidatus Polarisedimenticolia bacterium]|nr:YHS domain-containing protein [Candidatus Polarisedimenticolia bacterium]